MAGSARFPIFVINVRKPVLMTLQTILIVDDDPFIQAYMAKVINELGYEVITANNGKSGLETAGALLPDLILLDWNMPEMDGIETLSRLKQNHKTKMIPAIMVTGIMTSHENMKTALDAGVVDFLRKPFEKTELITRIRSVLKCNTFYDEAIARKDKQLTSATLQLAQQNELTKVIYTKLETLREQTRETDAALSDSINFLLADIKSRYATFNWEKFQEQFNAIHESFYKNLLSRHKDLTPAEMKLCTLLRLNLDTKEIAAISVQSYDSVRVARTRLRNTLTIDSEENLVSYLMQF